MPILYQHNENTLRVVSNRKWLRWSPHFHASLEIVHVRRGSSTVFVNDQEYRLVPDDLLIIFPHQIHGYRDDESIECALIFIPLNQITVFRDALCSTRPVAPILHEASRFPRMLELFSHIHDAIKLESPYSADILTGYLTAFLGQLLTQIRLAPANNIELSMVHNILHYCAVHYHEPLTLARVADEMHTHRNAVSAVFSQQLHIRFNDYLNSLRIEEACRLLRCSNDTITVISDAVGFETIRTFNRAFLRHCGVTPSEYREQKQKKA